MKRWRPSELLTLTLSMIACLSFALGLDDVSRREPPRGKASEELHIQEPSLAGSLRVVVSAEDGAGLPASTVQVFWERNRRFYWTTAVTTDGSGAALIAHLPEGRLWLLAEVQGYARGSSSLVLGVQPREVRLTLQPAQSLDVTVQDETGAPIVKATVLVDGADPLPFGALSDARGLAHFARLVRAPWAVKAAAAGYESVSRAGIRGALMLRLRRLASIRVSVLGTDGKPAQGATVWIAGSELWPARSALTDARGETRITGLLKGSYDLRASLESDVASTLLGFELARGANEQLTLTLEPGRMVVAQVTDGVGANPLLVANADVVLAESGLSSFPFRGRTGSDGRVSLGPIARGPATLGARALDFVGSKLVVVPELLEGPVQVPLTRGATLQGEVVDARGFPIEGATIEVVGSDPSGLPISETPELVGFRQNHFAWALSGPVPLVPAGELGVMPGPVPPIPALSRAGAEPALSPSSADFAEPSEIAPWISNRGGLFSARPISPGRLRAIVRHPDYVEGTSELVSVLPGGEAHVKIVLLHGASLEGTVLDEQGRPLGSIQLELSSPRATRTEFATSASDGSFGFAAVPAELTLSLARPENPSRIVLRKSLHIAEGTRERLELTLPIARDPVRVVVRDEDGHPIELVEVAATSLEPSRPMRLTRFTDAEGAVSFDDALGENLRVAAEAPGYARQVETLAAAPRDIELRLERGLRVEGRVTAVRGRRSVVGAVVSVEQSGMRKVATTDADGLFRIRDVAPGVVHIHIEHSDFADEERALQVASTGRADRPFTLPDIDLSEPGEVEGEVLDERGERVAGARVRAGDVQSPVPAGRTQHGVVTTDTDGHFVLAGVHPGTTTISAVSSVAGRGSARLVEVSSGRTTRGVRIAIAPQPTDADAALAAGSVAIGLGERGNGPEVAVVVVTVAESSEAERAGIEVGDVIVGVDGVRPNSMIDARARLSGQLGSDVVIEVERASTTSRFRVLREAVRR